MNAQIVANDSISTMICMPCWTVNLNFYLYCRKVARAQLDLLKDANFVRYHMGEAFAFTTFSSDMEYKLEDEPFDPLECKVECKDEFDDDALTAEDQPYCKLIIFIYICIKF